jgi:hypothetical protein
LTPAGAPGKFSLLLALVPDRIVTQHSAQARSRVSCIAALASALLVGLAGCGDDPFTATWFDEPDTTVLYSMQRPVEENLASGFSFYDRLPIRIEAPGATGNWDVALDTRGGELVLLPPGALGITAKAGIASLGAVPFGDIREAPSDTLLYELDAAVGMTLNHVYVVRTNRRRGNFGSSCVHYAKLSPVVLDLAENLMHFEYVASPICNNRDLFSPE